MELKKKKKKKKKKEKKKKERNLYSIVILACRFEVYEILPTESVCHALPPPIERISFTLRDKTLIRETNMSDQGLASTGLFEQLV